MQALSALLSIKGFIPHGYCLSWSPVLLWLHVISDLLITLAYYSIPLMLVYFIRQRKDFPYPWLITLFAGFIVACGTTHLLSAITIWIPLYWLDGLLKGFTAIISLVTAAMMLWVIPRALSLPSAAQLQAEIQQRKAIETARQETLDKLQKIASRVPGLVYQYRLRPDGGSCFPYASAAIRDIYRVGPEEVREDAAKILAILHPDDYAGIIASIQKSAQDLVPWRYEYRVKFNDGTVRWLLGNALPEREADGSTLWHGFITDITERKLMEQKLSDSDAFNVSILDSLTSHIAVLDAQGVIVAVNSAWLQFGKENDLQKSSLGVNYLDACDNTFNQRDGNEAIAAQSGIASVLRGEQASFQFEYPCHSPAEQRWFYMRVSPLQGLGGGVVVSHENITERKQAERILTLLKAMIDISLDGFWIVDLTGHLQQANEAYAKMIGYSMDELVNMHIAQLEVVEDSGQVDAHIAKVVTQGYDQFETRHRHKDGHIIDIEISVGFLPEFQQFCVFCRDITERKLMENALKASEAKFRSIIEVSPIPMALNDEQQNVTFLNPAFVQTFGYNIDDIPTLADWWPKAYPDSDYRRWVQSAWQSALEKANREQTDFPPLEVVIRCKDGSIKTVLASAAAIHHDFAGEHLAILYDISQRKQAEAKLDAIFNASVEGIISYDLSGIIVSANAAVATIFGYQPEELIGCSINKLMLSSSKETSPTAIKVAGRIQEIEGRHKNGSVVPLDLSIAEYVIDNTRYFTNIVRDVSLRKRREQRDKEHLDQLAHVTRLGLMGEMASGIAHEVNQPLTAISSYTQVSINLINTENPDLVKLAEILSKTQQQALRAGRIIHRMRAFVNSHVKQHAITDVNALIHNCVGLCAAELKQNGIKLTVELKNNLPPIHVDQIQIEQVIINLIRNSADALQHLPERQQRHISIQSSVTVNNHIQVRVVDNGPGLSEELQQKILMPFYTTKADGMGMGLSISRSLIEAHDGSLHFTSEPGKGSAFYFELPLQGKSDLI